MNNFGDDGISCWRMGDFNAISSGQLHMCSCSCCGNCIGCVTIICWSFFEQYSNKVIHFCFKSFKFQFACLSYSKLYYVTVSSLQNQKNVVEKVN